MRRLRLDRAQAARARRRWWDRHGAFVSGFILGCAACVTLVLAAHGLGLELTWAR